MDKNTLTGLFLIGIIIVIFSFWLQPSQQEINKYNKEKDSIALVGKSNTVSLAIKDTIAKTSSDIKVTATPFDSSKKAELISIENENFIAKISTKGAQIKSLKLKNFKNNSGQLVELMDSTAASNFGVQIPFQLAPVNTKDLVFTAQDAGFNIEGDAKKQITFRYFFTDNGYLDFVYSFSGNKYMVDFNIQTHNLQSLIPATIKELPLAWNNNAPLNEKDLTIEQRNSTIYFYDTEKDYDYISLTKDEEIKHDKPLKWFAFKSHFFTSTLIAKDEFNSSVLKTTTDLTKSHVKEFDANAGIPFAGNGDKDLAMQFYFGPNDYNTLKKYDLGLENQINLGWAFLKYINRWAVLPIFEFLGNFGMNYGLIILILTILLKVVLLPLTYTSYLSAAKMRLLKPEIDQLKEKLNNDTTKVQTETMKLYRKAGVNPLGGCIPLLLQLPILLAFFNFFPASIQLRGESFLWVKDLSSYDSIWTFGEIPIISTIYGNHVSLMCLLMTASTIIYTRLNNQISGANDQLKWMGYLMPVVFMGVLNNMPAGLNYYYFCANIITFGQQYYIRSRVDETKLHAQMEENKKKPESAKKSNFQTRLEEMAKKSAENREAQKKLRGK